jgi:large subunit ribosomal protein L17
MLNNMACSLFAHGRVITTEAKAKELRPFAEKLITMARRGDLHSRRLVARRIKDREVLGRLFSEIGPRFAARPRRTAQPERKRGPSGPLFSTNWLS